MLNSISVIELHKKTENFNSTTNNHQKSKWNPAGVISSEEVKNKFLMPQMHKLDYESWVNSFLFNFGGGRVTIVYAITCSPVPYQ